MWLDNASQDAVNLFWQLCGELEPFPRNLERSVALALPVAVVKLPRLMLPDVEHWLRTRRVSFRFGCDNRAVRGCLIAFGGKGLIFVDGADEDDERRVTLAHEVAHFMVDYWQPREKAIRELGPAIADVIDGRRPPTVRERLGACIRGVSIGIHTDLMERDPEKRGTNLDLWHTENVVDKVALTLLAPPDAVLDITDLSGTTFRERRRSLIAVMQGHFGLPPGVVRSYSYSLLVSIGRGPSWLESLRFTTG